MEIDGLVALAVLQVVTYDGKRHGSKKTKLIGIKSIVAV
jgi:hypothetical protein